MAEQLALVLRDDFTADQDQVSLISETDGFEVALDGWRQQSTPEKGGHVFETLKLRARGTSVDNLASKLQGMADKGWQAERWGAIDRYGVWLRAQLPNESYGRQAFVFGLAHEQASSVYGYALRQYSRIMEYTVAIERSPYWEGTASYDITSGTALSSMGGTLQYGTVPGDVPARMALVKIECGTILCGAGGTSEIGPWYVGFRSSRYGNPGSFLPYWDYRLGTNHQGGTTLPYTNSRSGTVVAWGTAWDAFGTTDPMSFLSGIRMENVTTKYYDQCGRYMAILRANPNGGTFSVQLRYGVYDWISSHSNSKVLLNGGTVMSLYPLGEVSIGNQAPYSVDGSALVWSGFFLNTFCQRIGGANQLYFDTIFLVPLEGFVKFDMPHASDSDVNIYKAMQRADGKIEFVIGGGDMLGAENIPYNVGGVQMQGGIPPGSGVAVVVGDAGLHPSATLKCKLTARAMPRWKELRGADT